MTKISFDIYRFSLPLFFPLQLKKSFIHSRDGYIICLHMDGCTAFGEVSPLPFFHNETISQVEHELFYFKKKVENLSAFLSHQSILDILKEFSFSPSVLWGIDVLFWNFYAIKKKVLPVQLWNKNHAKSVTVNGLLSGSQKEIIAQAQILAEEQVDVVKLKVGRKSVDEDIGNIKHIHDLLGSHVQIRLDANRSWNKKTALVFTERILPFNIEYLEEPVSQKYLSSFLQQTNIPIALDESIYEGISPQNPLCQDIATFVIKPSLLGSINKTFDWITWCEQNNKKYTISSTFETGIGLRMLANLALLSSNPTAAGLDTYKWFVQDVVRKKMVDQNRILDENLFYSGDDIQWDCARILQV